MRTQNRCLVCISIPNISDILGFGCSDGFWYASPEDEQGRQVRDSKAGCFTVLRLRACLHQDLWSRAQIHKHYLASRMRPL